MTPLQREALQMCLEYIETDAHERRHVRWKINEALAQPAQPKYRRGDRLICLETEEYCVIHISGTDRQWVKFPTSYIGVYANEQVAELFELLPKEPEQEPVAGCVCRWNSEGDRVVTCERHQGWLEVIAEWADRAREAEKKLKVLNTSPPAQEIVCSTGLCHYRKPLTDGQKLMCWSRATHDADVEHKTENQCLMDYGSEIEAAHGIKENT